jgi:Raf kinase inhibitor-like YbhB/YbcL family protein
MTVERTLGRLLRSIHAGDRHLAWNDPRLRDVPAIIRLSSSAFAEGTPMPNRCAGIGVGDNASPPLTWSNLPAGTTELVLIMQDPDAPLPRPVTHLIAIIPPDRDGIGEGVLTPNKDQTIRFGRGFLRRIGYAGPRPPQGHGPHRYIFDIYALAQRLTGPTTPDLGSAISGIARSVLAKGRLIGTFERP